MATGDSITTATHLGRDVSGLYTTDASAIGAAGSRCRVNATRGVSLLGYNYVMEQMNKANTSWIVRSSGSIGSSGSVSHIHDTWEGGGTGRPRWRWRRTGGNGAATMRFRMYGRGRVGGYKIYWCTNDVGSVGGSIPADSWKANSGWSITWARRVNLTVDY